MRNIMENLFGELLNLIKIAFAPICLEEAGTSIKAIGVGSENNIPFLDSLREKVTTHI